MTLNALNNWAQNFLSDSFFFFFFFIFGGKFFIIFEKAWFAGCMCNLIENVVPGSLVSVTAVRDITSICENTFDKLNVFDILKEGDMYLFYYFHFF